MPDTGKEYFMEQVRSAYEKSSLAVIMLNSDLTHMYSNSAAKLYFRMFCMRDGVRSCMGEPAVQKVLQELDRCDMFRYVPQTGGSFRALIFSNVYNGSGEREAINLRVEESGSIGETVSRFFPNIDVMSILNNEYLMPVTNLFVAIDYLRKRYSSDSTLCAYLDRMKDNVYQSMLSVHKFCDIISIRLDSVQVEHRVVNASAVAQRIFEHFGISCYVASDLTDGYVIAGTDEILTKILTDSILYLVGLDFINKVKNSIGAEIEKDGDNLRISLHADRVRRPDTADVFSPSLTPQGHLRTNLFGVKQLVESLGGRVSAEYIRRGSTYFYLRLYFSRIFMPATTLSDFDTYTEDLLLNTFAAERHMILKLLER